MNILFISYRFYPVIGGIEVNSEVLANYFCSIGTDVRLVTTTADLGDKNFPFPVIRRPNIHQLLKLHKWADIVFENNPSLRLSWPNLLIRKPLVVAIRTWISRGNGVRAWKDHLKLLWVSRANSMIAVSKAVQQETSSNAIIIGNPYRKSLFRSNGNNERLKTFVFVGRLVSDKGADLAIEAFANLTKKLREEISLTIIGEGPELNKLKLLSEKLEIKDKVFFTGALKSERLVEEMNKHMILLVPSRWKEPFGNVALEGIACGCIPIVSDGGGLPDAVGDAGLLFRRNDVNELLNNMEKILTDKSLRHQLQENGKRHIKMYFPEVIGQKYYQIILKALS